MSTDYGTVKILLRPESSPQTVEYVKDLVSKGVYRGCDIYRVEPPGLTKDEGGTEYREGYALVQGGAYSCGKQASNKLPVESLLQVKKWTVALIAGTSEFFFSLGDHPDWDGAFSIWGEVLDEKSQKVLEKIVGLPTKQEKHPTGTVLRILVEGVKFSFSFP